MESEPVRKRIAPWVEKYRPSTVDEVSHQDEVIRTLKMSIDQGNLPHLLFHGPPGTGKTTTILAVARALYGPELYRSRILELNASDDRGISVVREKIKVFAQGAVGGQKTPGYPCPRFKLIILDEADTMTPDAQSALRRVMEAYSKVTRFVMICNYVTRIIEPLASRCAKFRFKPLPISSMTERMNYIAGAEGVVLANGAMDSILEASGGDMRRAVTFLQSCQQLCGGIGRPITTDIVIDISGKIPRYVIENLWNTMNTTTRFDTVLSIAQGIIADGYPLAAVIAQLHELVVHVSGVTDLNKALICEKLAQVDQCLADGANEELQLIDLAAFIMRRNNNPGIDMMEITTMH